MTKPRTNSNTHRLRYAFNKFVQGTGILSGVKTALDYGANFLESIGIPMEWIFPAINAVSSANYKSQAYAQGGYGIIREDVPDKSPYFYQTKRNKTPGKFTPNIFGKGKAYEEEKYWDYIHVMDRTPGEKLAHQIKLGKKIRPKIIPRIKDPDFETIHMRPSFGPMGYAS